MYKSKGMWLSCLLVIICSYLCITPVSIAGSKTFVAGDDSGSNDELGPRGDGRANLTYALGSGSSLVFYKNTSPTATPANVILKYNQIDTGHDVGGNGFVYCTLHNNASGERMKLTHSMVPANKTYGGHQLFKTNIQGLYYNITIANFRTYRALITAPAGITYIGDSAYTELTFNDNENLCDSKQDPSRKTPRYQIYGGITADITIEFFTDNTFSATTGETIELLSSSSDYLFKYHTDGAGVEIRNRSIYVKFNMANVSITEPTCFTSIVSGDTVVNGNEVQLGNHSPQSISDGLADVPFAIELKNCIRIRDIEVKLKTNISGRDATLLGNTLTDSTAAAGVGVQIQGEATTKSSKMVMKPNDITSVYKDYEDEIDTSNGIFGGGAEGTPTSQTLHFLATLKPDSNIAIIPGNFKASAVFSVSYP
ncbi:fimbrial protein [Superficieibacter sp. HKU1]|uniref:fimbrial protein n=1 Tax=Superficieibacter sp. HKU1 TaxID=3031919 RepID=UPI0023E21D6C|nr:fimbrial protein [Superficieibacter sp. HKU1]WES68838.1 fimbrial protein [Superficieibacter sp. HKU1]